MADEKEFFCSDLAREYEVPLIASATRGDIWFLIEYTGAWGPKALEESEISEDAKQYLSGFNVDGNRVRILLIRQDSSKQRQGITFFIGQTSVLEPRLYEYHLDDYSDILNIDLSWLHSEREGGSANLRDTPIFLVCTNGRRDKCCALYGPNVYQALSEEAGDAVWQSSHIGGHNQAPIMLFFPHGVNYGRAMPADARRLLSEYQKNNIVLAHYRGRVGYETHLQAAEHFWREQTGILELPGLRIDTVSQVDEDQWDLAVCSVTGDKAVRVRIVRRWSDFSIPITCTKKKESKIVTFHRAG